MNVKYCKYYNGCQNKKCIKGISYSDVTPRIGESGSGLRMACLARPFDERSSSKEEFDNKGYCESFKEPTAEEIEENEDKFNTYIIELVKLVLPLCDQIKNIHKGSNWNGQVKCPKCGGKLNASHAACNGHVHGKCETEDCLSWME